MSEVYFNEIDEVACAVLREVHGGHVDGRSIKEVIPADVRPFRRVHWFAGAGLWEVACKIAGWDDRQLWTASCPCQPFSSAGKGLGADDPRHLWPDLFRLVSAEWPSCIVGEQVAGKAGDAWLDGVCADLESIDYAVRAVEIPASAVDSPQKRSRNWWVAMGNGHSARTNVHAASGRPWTATCESDGGPMADADPRRQQILRQSERTQLESASGPLVERCDADGQFEGESPMRLASTIGGRGGVGTRLPGRARTDEMLLNGLMSQWRTPDVNFPSPKATLTKLSGRTPQDPQVGLADEMNHFGKTPSGSTAQTEKRGAPNPVFACWLMGWPEELTSGALLAIQSFRKSPRKSSRRSLTAVSNDKQ